MIAIGKQATQKSLDLGYSSMQKGVIDEI